MSKSGIYAIRNTINGRLYIGSAVDLDGRFAMHRYSLCRGSHHNQHLQRAYSKYGSTVFDFVVLERIHRTRLIEREQVYLDYAFKMKMMPYNISSIAGSSLNTKHSYEARCKMSIAQKGNRNAIGNKIWVGRHHSLEARKKMSTAKLGNRYCVGRNLSTETKTKISAALTGNKNSCGHKNHLGHKRPIKAGMEPQRGE